jgi:LacI family transcriptional regulator
MPLRARHITLEDIAKAVGTSRSTVSRALRNEPRISEAMRGRVQRVAQELGYRPDPAMTALAAYRNQVRPPSDHGTLAVLNALPRPNLQLGDDELPLFFRQQLAGVRRRAAALGYRVELFKLLPDVRQHEELSRRLTARGIQGLVVGGLPQGFGAVGMQWERFASSSIGRSMLEPRLHNASYNYAEDVEGVYRRLRTRGYRRIGFCNHQVSEQRAQYANVSGYFKSTFLDGEVHGGCPPLLTADPLMADVVAWVRRYRIDAIIGRSYVEEIERRLREAGIGIPEEVGLVSTTLEYADEVTAGLREDMEALGEAAVTLLHAMLLNGERGVPRQRHQVLLNASWQEGKTLRGVVEATT